MDTGVEWIWICMWIWVWIGYGIGMDTWDGGPVGDKYYDVIMPCGSRVQDPGPRIQDPGASIQGPGSKIQLPVRFQTRSNARFGLGISPWTVWVP